MQTAPDWHLHAWAAEHGKTQNSLVTELGWQKNAAHRLWHGKQPYRRDEVNQIAAWLGIEPYELLMSPDQARRVRALSAALGDISGAREAVRAST